uniref:Uncharacterized protein n=1 Tax=Bionectria ochroleuca TaxID=29856 RepID=A0A8H7TVK0_BIOOC
MSPRVPRLPAAKTSEVLCMGAAGVGVLAPFWFLMPGTEDRLSKQTNKWAPRWERNVSYLAPPMERGVQRIEPPSPAPPSASPSASISSRWPRASTGASARASTASTADRRRRHKHTARTVLRFMT